MEQKLRLGYKHYLRSCRIQDISPRILRRRNYKRKRRVVKRSVSCKDVPQNMDTETPSNVNSESSVVNEVNTDVQKFNGSDANINTEIFEINCSRNEMMECDLDLLHDLRNDGSEEDKDILQSHCLQDLMSNSEFFSCIQIPVNKSPAEVLLMVLEHALKYKASLTEISSILQLINIIFSRLILPYTRSVLDRILNPKRTLKYHGICPNCCAYMGSIDNCKCSVTCNGCSEVIDFNGPSSSNIFLIIDPSEKIKLLIEENQSYYNYVVKERKYSGKITDIFDGKCYRSFVKNYLLMRDTVTQPQSSIQMGHLDSNARNILYGQYIYKLMSFQSKLD
ncbi:uncharacterized protein [Temnothorax longispinosus]|uniref:uncharacterized protein n=1 Tax=Temnothorax longispinosus TaxID=300112 RepID=UPI003A9A33BB